MIIVVRLLDSNRWVVIYISLNSIERENTINELHQSFDNSGLNLATVAQDLQTDANYIEDILNLKVRRIEDPWILKSYLERYNQKHQKNKVIFTALSGDYHDYGFLNSHLIDQATLK